MDTRTQQAIEDAHLRGEETPWETAVRGPLPGASGYAAFYIDPQEPVDEALQSYDPRQDRQEQPKMKEKPGPMGADMMLNRYYAALVFGKLDNVLAVRDATGSDCGDEGQAVVRYVEDFMADARPTLRPIVLHRMGGESWASWYGTPSRSLAAYLFNDFRDRLEAHLKAKPFVYDPTPVFREDHLESADRANLK